MLELDGVQSGYGDTRVLHGVNLTVQPGTVHALLGRNGAGKSTTLKTIMGILGATAGAIRFQGRSIAGGRVFDIARAGIAYVPETRDIFGSLTVRENLALAGRAAPADSEWPVERVLDLFPNLKERHANGGHQLSGGEQQMLAIGRALMTGPRLMLLDEPTEGLAPIIVQQILDKLAALKEAGMTILLVEQNLRFATRLADEISLVSRGTCVWNGRPEALRNDPALQAQWLGV
jgi:branched-chain amino acid transport system ATP-binding protein